MQFEKNVLPKWYKQEELKNLVIEYFKTLEKISKEESVDFWMLDFESLSEEDKKATLDFEKNKKYKKFYNLNPSDYGI